MSKKFIIFAAVLLIASFSSGIFTEIVISSEVLKIPAKLPGVIAVIFDYLKDDFLTTLAALLFSVSVFLMPLIPLMFIGKTFSLGYSAAYLLSSNAENAWGILFSALVPRGIFKIPAYIALVIVSFETARFMKNNYHSPNVLKRGMPKHLLRFLACFSLLAMSSILEAVLLKSVL
ncbi:MAG: stage II sporulation protein M [Emergencia sp.]|nr:stage II sporulation protein M [Emergencia sp.]